MRVPLSLAVQTMGPTELQFLVLDGKVETVVLSGDNLVSHRDCTQCCQLCGYWWQGHILIETTKLHMPLTVYLNSNLTSGP